ncbi:MAG: hypothetical protein M1144_03335 [Candidatus Thermoplasmatota archaeon]|nr:hypothetical protein [Candidatus Thermoplasmatota archaeon]MCL5984904.1 hypothetical protein [Candidatus Thermoplasmatota archaeon]
MRSLARQRVHLHELDLAPAWMLGMRKFLALLVEVMARVGSVGKKKGMENRGMNTVE